MWEQRPSASEEIRSVWRAHVDATAEFDAEATEHWGIAFARSADGRVSATLDGPCLETRRVAGYAGDDYWGAELAPHVVIPGVDKTLLRGAFSELPVEGGRVVIGDRGYAIPEFDGLEAFVALLVADGALVADADIRRALAGDDAGLSARSWQRRFQAVAGVRRKEIERLERSRLAFRLLSEGMRPIEVAVAAGYSDQAHLSRELRRIRGETPARILAASAT